MKLLVTDVIITLGVKKEIDKIKYVYFSQFLFLPFYTLPILLLILPEIILKIHKSIIQKYKISYLQKKKKSG